MKKTILTLLIMIAAIALSGCSHVISKSARNQSPTAPSFGELKTNPAAFTDQQFLFGGLILSIKNEPDQTILEIFRYRLDSSGVPIEAAENSGRAYLVYNRFLDPLLYAPGKFITVAARFRTTTVAPSSAGPINYVYPTFEVVESYLWDTPFREGIYPGPNLYLPVPDPRLYPPRTNPYDPNAMPYPYSPYWYAPPASR